MYKFIKKRSFFHEIANVYPFNATVFQPKYNETMFEVVSSS